MNTTSLKLIIFFILSTSSVVKAQSITLGDFNKSLKSLDCTTLQNNQKNALCTSPMIAFSQALTESNITLANNDIIISDDQFFKPQSINTGSKCRTKEITGGYLKITLKSNSSLKIFDSKKMSDLSLDKPILLGSKINVGVETRTYFKEKIGLYDVIFDKCRSVATDNWSATSSISTEADLLVGISLRPKYAPITIEDQVLVLRPAAFAWAQPKKLTGDFKIEDKDDLVFPLLSSVIFASQQPFTLSNMATRIGFNATNANDFDDLWKTSKPLIENYAYETLSVTADLTVPILDSVPSKIAINKLFDSIGDIGMRSGPGLSLLLRNKIYNALNTSISNALGQDATGTYYIFLPNSKTVTNSELPLTEAPAYIRVVAPGVISWAAVAGTAYYELEQYTSSWKFFGRLTGLATTFGGSSVFRVRACDSTARCSAWRQ